MHEVERKREDLNTHSISISYQLSILTIAYIFQMLSRFLKPYLVGYSNTSLEAEVLVPNLEMRKLKFGRIK